MQTQHAVLETLRVQVGASAVEELAQIEERSAKRRELERELQQKDKELLTLRAGASLEEFEAAVLQLDADRIDLDLARLSQEQEHLQNQLKDVDQMIGSERNELARMNGCADAADAAQRLEDLSTQMRADLGEYIILRVAAGILKKGIERYRQKNEGPILQRASALFEMLTAGSFGGLQLEQNDAGEPVLVGVRGKDRSLIGAARR